MRTVKLKVKTIHGYVCEECGEGYCVFDVRLRVRDKGRKETVNTHLCSSCLKSFCDDCLKAWAE